MVTYSDMTDEEINVLNGVATLRNRNIVEDITINIQDANFFDIMDQQFNIHCESPPLEVLLVGKTFFI